MVDWDVLEEEFEVPDDTSVSTPPAVVKEKAAAVGLPLTSPKTVSMPAPFPAKRAVELVEEPEKLFDFSSTSLTPQQQLYIISYAVRGTHLGALKMAGVTHNVVQKWMENEEFRNALQAAVDMVKDALEEELFRRAMNGSDKLLLEAVRAAKREKYRPDKNVSVQGQIVHSWSELAREAARVIDVTPTTIVEEAGDTDDGESESDGDDESEGD